MGHDLNRPDVLGRWLPLERAQVASEDWEDERLLKTGPVLELIPGVEDSSPAVVLSSSGTQLFLSPCCLVYFFLVFSPNSRPPLGKAFLDFPCRMSVLPGSLCGLCIFYMVITHL